LASQLMRRVVIEYWRDKEPTTAQDYDDLVSKLQDCGHPDTFEKIARSYCPSGVHVVVRAE